MYALDSNGRPIVGFDNKPQLSQWGTLYVQALGIVKQRGVTRAGDMDFFAQQMVNSHLAAQGQGQTQSQEQPVPTGQPPAQQPAGQSWSRTQGGGRGNRDGASRTLPPSQAQQNGGNPPPDDGLDMRAALARDMAKAGITDDVLASSLQNHM